MVDLRVIELDMVGVVVLFRERERERSVDHRRIGVEHAVAVEDQLAFAQLRRLVHPRMIDGRIEILEKLTMDFVEHKRRERKGVSLEDLHDAATHRICLVLGIVVGAGCGGRRGYRLLTVVDLDQLAHFGSGLLALDIVACQRFRIGREGKPVDSLQSGGCAPILRARFWAGWLAQRFIGEVSGVFCGHRISNDAVNADVA